jgi:hypothetical protein
VIGRALARPWTKEQSNHAVRNKGDSGVMDSKQWVVQLANRLFR